MEQKSTVQEMPGAIRDRVSEAEWQTRVQLAACYRMVAHFGWDDLIYTHISARVPDHRDQFLINPFGMMFHEVTASSLVKVDEAGEIVLDNGYKVNSAGFTIHSAVHTARPDVDCVIHLHTPHGVAVSARREGVLPISQTALIVCNRLAYHDYEGIALDLDERERVVADLGDRDLMMLRNHGTLACGRTIPLAFQNIYFLEKACECQVAAARGGSELLTLADEVQAKVDAQTAEVMRTANTAWRALVRLVDARYPGYEK